VVRANGRRKISTTLKEVVRDDGIQGLWRGTIPTLVRYVPSSPSLVISIKLIYRNVPGVALYFYVLSAIRTELSYLTQFQTLAPLTSTSTPTSSTGNGSGTGSGSALVKLSVPGNLIAGAIARTSVGFALNPITVLKARYEVRRAVTPSSSMG
jgi:solute carrier family 25 protein 38